MNEYHHRGDFFNIWIVEGIISEENNWVRKVEHLKTCQKSIYKLKILLKVALKNYLK